MRTSLGFLENSWEDFLVCWLQYPIFWGGKFSLARFRITLLVNFHRTWFPWVAFGQSSQCIVLNTTKDGLFWCWMFCSQCQIRLMLIDTAMIGTANNQSQLERFPFRKFWWRNRPERQFSRKRFRKFRKLLRWIRKCEPFNRNFLEFERIPFYLKTSCSDSKSNGTVLSTQENFRKKKKKKIAFSRYSSFLVLQFASSH